MCGIAGFYASGDKTSTGHIVQEMIASISSRGPDATKFFHHDNISLGHCRLAIIDLLTGDQPIHSSNGTTVVANGEIYNYIELKQEPECRAYSYRTASDCEVILPLYAHHGSFLTNKLRGMYALAVYDRLSDTLVLSRDPFGMKPLYYVETEQGLLFASEIKGLLAAKSISPEISKSQVYAFLEHHFTLGRKTIFRGIHRVLPGETLVVQDGKVVDRNVRSMVPRKAPSPLSVDATPSG